MKKAFLTKSVIISVLVVDLVAGGMKVAGVISDGIDQAPLGTLIRAWHDGTLATALKGNQTPDYVTTIPTTKTTVAKDSADSTETVDSTETSAAATATDSAASSTDTTPESEKTYEFVTVDDSYFADACLIGDSRAGLVEYWNGMPGMTYHTVSGYSIYEMLTKSWCDYNGQKCTLEESLSYDYDKYGKVYIETGINGAGYDTLEEWKEANEQMIALIEYTQPHAVIFLCSCLAVTDEMSNEPDTVVSNEQINEHNDVLMELCDNNTVFYLNVNAYFCIEDGSLNPDYSSDGYHVTNDYTYLWRECFLDHGIVRD